MIKKKLSKMITKSYQKNNNFFIKSYQKNDKKKSYQKNDKKKLPKK